MRISDWSSDVCSSDLRLRDETGIPIVYVSHSVADVARLATSLIVLSNGRVAAAGRTAEVMAQLKLYPRADRLDTEAPPVEAAGARGRHARQAALRTGPHGMTY